MKNRILILGLILLSLASGNFRLALVDGDNLFGVVVWFKLMSGRI
jgi:hypothetical protein